MARGISIHIGLNSVDPNHYGGWSGELNACEADAADMALIAANSGFQTSTILTATASRSQVLNALQQAEGLAAGDILFVSYSGHGGQLPDMNGDEPDALDETWCLYDGELVDDELYVALGKVKAGVRILVLSDSCHSGTVIKNSALTLALVNSEIPRYRAMPDDISYRTYLQNKEFYDKILADPAKKKAKQKFAASALLISGCQDNQLSGDGPFNGVFTAQLKRVWNGGKFSKDYVAFHKTILKGMPPDQTPKFFTVGPDNPGFLGQRPFSI
jgi:metacaspase-1